MSEITKLEVFKYLVGEYAKLEAEEYTAYERKDHKTASTARQERDKLETTAVTLGLNLKQLQMQGFGYSLDILQSN